MSREADTTQDHDQLHLVLHLDQAVYSIGEPIRPKLQILNNTAQQIGIGQGLVFNRERLAFADPNAVHLMGPNGADMAPCYRREQSYFAAFKPIVVDSAGEEWLYLPVHTFFHLREQGEYTLWVELSDEAGTLHRSNRISFQLVEVEAFAQPGLVELALKSSRPSFPISQLDDVVLEAAFTSKHVGPLIFMKPQEDSYYGWVNPVYQFTVMDGSGRTLALPERCGTMATPAYNNATQFVLLAKQTYRQELRLPEFLELRHPGKYRVRLTYIVRGKAIGKDGVVLEKPVNWDKHVFVGRLESNEVVIAMS